MCVCVSDCMLLLRVIRAGRTEARVTSRLSISTCHWPTAQLRSARPQDARAHATTHAHRRTQQTCSVVSVFADLSHLNVFRLPKNVVFDFLYEV